MSAGGNRRKRRRGAGGKRTAKGRNARTKVRPGKQVGKDIAERVASAMDTLPHAGIDKTAVLVIFMRVHDSDLDGMDDEQMHRELGDMIQDYRTVNALKKPCGHRTPDEEALVEDLSNELREQLRVEDDDPDAGHFQKAMVCSLEQIGSFRYESRLVGYLATIARRALTASLRRRKRQRNIGKLGEKGVAVVDRPRGTDFAEEMHRHLQSPAVREVQVLCCRDTWKHGYETPGGRRGVARRVIEMHVAGEATEEIASKTGAHPQEVLRMRGEARKRSRAYLVTAIEGRKTDERVLRSVAVNATQRGTLAKQDIPTLRLLGRLGAVANECGSHEVALALTMLSHAAFAPGVTRRLLNDRFIYLPASSNSPGDPAGLIEKMIVFCTGHEEELARTREGARRAHAGHLVADAVYQVGALGLGDLKQILKNAGPLGEDEEKAFRWMIHELLGLGRGEPCPSAARSLARIEAKFCPA